MQPRQSPKNMVQEVRQKQHLHQQRKANSDDGNNYSERFACAAEAGCRRRGSEVERLGGLVIWWFRGLVIVRLGGLVVVSLGGLVIVRLGGLVVVRLGG